MTEWDSSEPPPGRAPKAVNKFAQSQHMGALTAWKTRNFIGARHRGRFAQRDAPVAITIAAREPACLICIVVTQGECVERGMDAYEQRRLDRTVSNLGRRAKRVGYQLVRLAEDTDWTSDVESMARGCSCPGERAQSGRGKTGVTAGSCVSCVRRNTRRTNDTSPQHGRPPATAAKQLRSMPGIAVA